MSVRPCPICRRDFETDRDPWFSEHQDSVPLSVGDMMMWTQLICERCTHAGLGCRAHAEFTSDDFPETMALRRKFLHALPCASEVAQ